MGYYSTNSAEFLQTFEKKQRLHGKFTFCLCGQSCQWHGLVKKENTTHRKRASFLFIFFVLSIFYLLDLGYEQLYRIEQLDGS